MTTIPHPIVFHEQYYFQESQSSNVVFMQLDLACQKSIRSFAETFLKTEKRLDILINNAGLVEFCTMPFSSTIMQDLVLKKIIQMKGLK